MIGVLETLQTEHRLREAKEFWCDWLRAHYFSGLSLNLYNHRDFGRGGFRSESHKISLEYEVRGLDYGDRKQ